MSIIPVPTLSAKGYVISINEKLDTLMAHFFASDANQDFLHNGFIANLSILLQECGQDIIQLKERIRSDLTQYFGRFFDEAIVTVDDDSATTATGKVNLVITALVTQDGIQHDVANCLSLVNGKFEKITKLNNTGSAN